jgi:hypothetical protein
MDINYISKWTSFWLFLAVSLVYVFYFIKYSTWFLKPLEGLNNNETKLLRVIGWMKLLVAFQMIVGLYYVIKLNPPMASAHVGFSGLMILVMSLSKVFYLDEKYHIGKLELFITLLGFLFLSFHIIARIF